MVGNVLLTSEVYEVGYSLFLTIFWLMFYSSMLQYGLHTKRCQHTRKINGQMWVLRFLTMWKVL